MVANCFVSAILADRRLSPSPFAASQVSGDLGSRTFWIQPDRYTRNPDGDRYIEDVPTTTTTSNTQVFPTTTTTSTTTTSTTSTTTTTTFFIDLSGWWRWRKPPALWDGSIHTAKQPTYTHRTCVPCSWTTMTTTAQPPAISSKPNDTGALNPSSKNNTTPSTCTTTLTGGVPRAFDGWCEISGPFTERMATTTEWGWDDPFAVELAANELPTDYCVDFEFSLSGEAGWDKSTHGHQTVP